MTDIDHGIALTVAAARAYPRRWMPPMPGRSWRMVRIAQRRCAARCRARLPRRGRRRRRSWPGRTRRTGARSASSRSATDEVVGAARSGLPARGGCDDRSSSTSMHRPRADGAKAPRRRCSRRSRTRRALLGSHVDPDLGPCTGRTAQGPRLRPPTGWGSIPADDRQTVFCLENGFTLEQVERNSVFDMHARSTASSGCSPKPLEQAGPDYRPVAWTSPTPGALSGGLRVRHVADVDGRPQGGLDVDEQTWDAARVRRRDARLTAQGFTVSVACVEHVPSGRIAAYNELVIAGDHTGADAPVGHARAEGAPRPPAGDDREVREPPALA